MKILKVLAYVVGGLLVVRAVVDLFNHITSQSETSSTAQQAMQDCLHIWRENKIQSTDFREKLLRDCAEYGKQGSRWFLWEAVKAWLAGLWFCETLHCSEYVFPLADWAANVFTIGFLFAIFMGILVFSMCRSPFYSYPAPYQPPPVAYYPSSHYQGGGPPLLQIQSGGQPHTPTGPLRIAFDKKYK